MEQFCILPPFGRLLTILHEAEVNFCSIFSSFGDVRLQERNLVLVAESPELILKLKIVKVDIVQN